MFAKILKISFPFFALLLLLIVIALGLGSVKIGFADLISVLFSGDGNENLGRIIFDLRLPRVLLAVAVGGGLSVSGAVLQSILKNPLAEPYVLGISSGGTFGALISMLLGFSFFVTQIFAFTGSLLVVAFVLFAGSKFKYGFKPVSVLLSGVMIGAFFGAAILIILTLMRENLQTAVFWLVGSLSFASPRSSYYSFFFSLSLSFAIFLYGYKLNLIALENNETETFGVNPKRDTNILLILTGVLTGGLVAVSGVIGFVGMVVPHLVRTKFGYDNRIVLPTAFLLGAILLLVSDTFARTVALPSELPVGAITAIFGAPIFIWLLRKKDYYFTSA